MKIDKFDQLSEKLLNKLNEDLVLFEGEEDADGMMDPKKSLQKTLTDKKNKETEEASKTYQNLKKFPNSPNKEINTKLHKKEIIEREDATNKVRKAKLFEETDILTADDLNDYDVHDLAEEFDADLEEANQQMLNNAKQLETMQKDKVAKENQKIQQEKEVLSDKETQVSEQQEAEKEKVTQDLQKKQKEETKEVQNDKAELDEKKKKIEEENARKMQKINAIKETAKNQSTTGGTAMKLTNEEYDTNVKMFKEEIEKQQALEESFKKWRAEHKKKKYGEQSTKVGNKINKVTSKLDELSDKEGINDENAEQFEYTAKEGHARRRAKRIKAKWKKLKYVESKLRDANKDIEDKLIKAESESDQINENLEYFKAIDMLCEEADCIIAESYETDEDEILTEGKKSKKDDAKVTAAVNKNGEKISGSIDFGDGTQYIPPENKQNHNEVEHDPIRANYARQWNDEKDPERRKQIAMKIAEYDDEPKKKNKEKDRD